MHLSKRTAVPRLKTHHSGSVNPAFGGGNAVFIQSKNRIAGTVAGGQGRTAEHAGQSVVIQRHVRMPVSPDDEPGADPFQFTGHIEVVEHRRVQRIVVDKDRLLAGRELLEPLQAFLREQGGSHPHVGPAVAAYEPPPLAVKREAFIPEDIPKGVATAFRPLGIMVSGHDIILASQGIQHFLDSGDLLIGTEFGEVAPHQHKIQIVPGIEIPDAGPQIRDGGTVCRVMQVREKGEPHPGTLRGCYDSAQGKRDDSQNDFSETHNRRCLLEVLPNIVKKKQCSGFATAGYPLSRRVPPGRNQCTRWP